MVSKIWKLFVARLSCFGLLKSKVSCRNKKVSLRDKTIWREQVGQTHNEIYSKLTPMPMLRRFQLSFLSVFANKCEHASMLGNYLATIKPGPVKSLYTKPDNWAPI
jgi:hypothetical protein